MILKDTKKKLSVKFNFKMRLHVTRLEAEQKQNFKSKIYKQNFASKTLQANKNP